MKVFVYFNLHKQCWSVKALQGDNKGRVIMHTNNLLLENATPRVSKAGRERVLSERRKNVHAGIVGNLCNFVGGVPTERAVSYNPYKADYFYYKDNEAEFKGANYAAFSVSQGVPSVKVGG